MAISLNSLQKILDGFKDRLLDSIKIENMGFAKAIITTDFSKFTEDNITLYKTRVDHSLNSVNIIGSVYDDSKHEIFCSVNPLTSNSVEIISDIPIKGVLVLMKNGQ